MPFRKDPDSRLDYKVAWDEWLGTDHIVSADVSAYQQVPAASSAGTIRVATHVVSANNKAHVIWLSAGTLNYEYGIISRVYTSAGRRNDSTFTVRIETR